VLIRMVWRESGCDEWWSGATSGGTRNIGAQDVPVTNDRWDPSSWGALVAVIVMTIAIVLLIALS
jgi:hypothetical protein